MRTILPSIFIISILLLALPQQSYSQSELPKNQAGESAGPTDIYIIGSGDILEIVTWKEPDFSREEVIVRIDGNISFPLLDDVMAAGKTPTQLKFDIQNRLSEYVAEPHVTVTVRSAASKRFYILGEVANTGEHPLVKDLTRFTGICACRRIYRMGIQERDSLIPSCKWKR